MSGLKSHSHFFCARTRWLLGVAAALLHSWLPASAGAVVAEDDLRAPVDDAADFSGDGWLRAYATGAIPGDAVLALPDYYETELESAARGVIADALGGMGREVVADAEATPYRIAYSVDWKRGGGKGLPQSPLRLEPEPQEQDDPASVRLDEPDRGLRPAIALGPKFERRADAPSVRVTIYLIGDGARLWSGFAEAELDGHAPSEVTKLLTRSLMARWGVSASFDDAAFLNSLHTE